MASILRDSYRASLLYDGVSIFSQAIDKLFRKEDLVMPNVDCRDREVSYQQGKQILSELQEVRNKENIACYILMLPCAKSCKVFPIFSA